MNELLFSIINFFILKISRNQNIQNEEKSEDCDKNSEALSSENSKSPNKENDKNCAQPALSTQSQEVFK